MVTASEALFHKHGPGVYTRKLSGSEAMWALLSEGNGRTHLTFSAKVKLVKRSLSADELLVKVRHAMIRLRHHVPAIGCTISRLPQKQEFQFRYEVPKSLGDAIKWATTVIILHDEPLSLEDAHARVTQTVWWKASDGRHTHMLTLFPSLEDDYSWTFILSVHHGNADGRSSWMMLEKLFMLLEDEILEEATPLNDLNWGEETRRLTAPSESIPSIAENGNPDEFFPIPDDFAPAAPPKGYVPFLYPFKAADGVDDGTIEVRLDLTRVETSRFHELCRKNNRTVTQAASALAALTNIEWILRIAAEKDEVYEEVATLFDESNFFQTALNVVDIRFLFPEGSRTLHSDHPPPLNSIDGFPLNFPFEPYRRLIALDKTHRTVSHLVDKVTFWNELVKDVADAWSKESRTLDAFRFRSALLTKMAADPNVDLSLFMTAAPVISSHGDLTRLDILERFRPSGNAAAAAATDAPALTVEALDHSTQMTQPSLFFCFFEYDGVFSFTALANRKYWTREEMDVYQAVLESWKDVLQ